MVAFARSVGAALFGVDARLVDIQVSVPGGGEHGVFRLVGMADGALREGKERIEKRAKVKITTLRVSGGGSQSDAAMQATADIFNLPASRPHTFETSGLGAAVACSVGLGLHRDFETAVAAMSRIGQTFEPDAGRAALYERLYTGVYAKMYERLQPLYAELHAALDR